MMSALSHSESMLPDRYSALLAMLGILPHDDALVLGQSGPAFSAEQSATLTAHRIQQAYQQLLAVAPLWSALLQHDEAMATTLAAFASHHGAAQLQTLLPMWRQQLRAATVAAGNAQATTLPSLETVLQCWQQLNDQFAQQNAAQTSRAAFMFNELLPAVASAPLSPSTRLPPSSLPTAAVPEHWQQTLALFAERAGHLSALALQHPVTAQVGEREAVWQQDGATLYRYPAAEHAPPVLLVYAWINRADVLDLAPAQSLIAALQAEGLAVWLLDWADAGAHGCTLDQYLFAHLDTAVKQVQTAMQVSRIALLGICQGGSLALSYAALRPAAIRSLSLAVTPIDFHTATDQISASAKGISATVLATVTALSPGPINLGFLQLKPYSLRTGKYLVLLQQPPDAVNLAAFLRLEHWLISGPLLSGPGLADYLERYYQQNALCRNALILAGQAVTLAELTIPVQVLIADHDHIVPPASSSALSALLPTPVAIERFATGHIGLLVGRARLAMAKKVSAFVKQHTDEVL